MGPVEQSSPVPDAIIGSVDYVGGARVPLGPCAPATRLSLGLRLASFPANGGKAAPAHAPREGHPLSPPALDARAPLRSFALQATKNVSTNGTPRRAGLAISIFIRCTPSTTLFDA